MSVNVCVCFLLFFFFVDNNRSLQIFINGVLAMLYPPFLVTVVFAYIFCMISFMLHIIVVTYSRYLCHNFHLS